MLTIFLVHVAAHVAVHMRRLIGCHVTVPVHVVVGGACRVIFS